MKSMKKMVCIALCAIMVLAVLPIANVSAKQWGFFSYEIVNDGVTITDCDETVSGYLTIPAEIEGVPVKMIGNEAFQECYDLVSVSLPNTITSIGKSAFEYCYDLMSITIPNSVITIGDYAFNSCDELSSITLGSGLTSIGDDCFSGVGITTLTIPKNVKTIGSFAFYRCSNLLSLTIESGVTNIGSYAFARCDNLVSLNIGNGLKTVGNSAFYDCKNLTSVTIPDSVTNIGSYAFGYYDFDWDELPVAGFTICGYTGSAAESYALSNGFSFTSIGIAHVHSYTAKVTKASTCSQTGIMTYACSCGDSYTQPIAVKSHTYKTTTTKATTSKAGSVVTKCSSCGVIASNYTIAKISSVKLSKTKFTYNGKAQKPTVTVKDSKGKTLKQGTDYTVKYSKGRKNVGQYTVTVTFKGNYSGTKKLTFKIVPKGTSISKLTADKKQFTANWKKRSTQTTGYEIQYSTSSKMKNAKTASVGKNSTTSKTIKSLKSSKTYYVRVRTYKTVKINGKNTKLYSSWSSAKKIKTK